MDDKSNLITCIENGEFTKAAKISSGETATSRVMNAHETAWHALIGQLPPPCNFTNAVYVTQRAVKSNIQALKSLKDRTCSSPHLITLMESTSGGPEVQGPRGA